MRIVVIVLLLLGAHFSLTAFVPGEKALVYWPWGADTKSLLTGLGGLPKDNAIVTTILAGLVGLLFIISLAALLGIIVPAEWFRPAVIATSLGSILLFLLHFSPIAIIPMVLDVVLLAGIFLQGWSVASLSNLP